MAVKIDDRIVKVEVVGEDKKEAAKPLGPYERPPALLGTTYKIKPPTLGAALYVTINDMEMEDGSLRPLEIFFSSKDVSHHEWTVALARVLSGHFRQRSDFTWVVEELRQVYDPKGGYFIPGTGVRVGGVVAHVGYLLEEHCKELGLIEVEELSEERKAELQEKGEAVRKQGKPGIQCLACHEMTAYIIEGCLTCLSCGASKCEGDMR
jgi:hypothetical protein